jgi:hypothetical protein
MIVIEQNNLNIEDTLKKAQEDITHNNESVVWHTPPPARSILVLVNSLIDVQQYIDTKFGKIDENFISKFIIPENPDIKVIRQITINEKTYTKYINVHLQPFGTIDNAL